MNRQWYEEARRAIIVQTGWTDEEFLRAMPEIVQHGPDSGYPGFCYFKDMLDFVRQNPLLCRVVIADKAKRAQQTPTEMLTSLPWCADVADPFFELAFDTEDAGYVAAAVAWLILTETAKHFSE